MKGWRVSMVESFRQWEQDEEAELDELLAKLRGDWPASPAMEAGTAFHKALEDAPTPLEADELVALGHRFTFAGDFDVELAPIREVRKWKVYMVDGLPISISGQVDGLDALRIDDHKTTGRFDPDRYLSGFQWRLYLDIFSAKHFRWNVFEMTEVASADELLAYEIRAAHRLEQFAYPALHEDCLALVTRFARFVREHAALIEQTLEAA